MTKTNIKPIYREREGDGWTRYFVKTPTGNPEKVNFQDPTADWRNGLVPVDTNLHLLAYLKISFPKSANLTFSYVVDFIPKELIEKVCAVEWVHGFFGLWDMTFFPEDAKKGNVVLFVALLTEEDTGKGLPGLGIDKTEKPIGVTEREWRSLLNG